MSPRLPRASLPWQRPRLCPLRTGADGDARAVPLSAGTERCQDAQTAGRPGSRQPRKLQRPPGQGLGQRQPPPAPPRADPRGPAAPTSAAAVTPPPAPCSGYIRAAAPVRSAPHGAAAGATARPPSRAWLSRAGLSGAELS